MVQIGHRESKTAICDLAGVGRDAPFDRAWASLLRDKHIHEDGTVLKARNQVPAYSVSTTNG